MFADRGFTSHEHLPWFNLLNMNGRLYDPLVGRFISPDPYVQMPDLTQNMNRYTYCLNNPLKYSDPSGYNHVVEDPWAYSGKHRSLEELMKELFGAQYEDSKRHEPNSKGGTGGSSNSQLIPITLPWIEGSVFVPQEVAEDPKKLEEYLRKNPKLLTQTGLKDNPYAEKSGGDDPKFYGADIRYIPESIPFGSYFAGAINTSKSIITYYEKFGLNSLSGKFLMHEFGHYLQNNYGGSVWYLLAVVPTSVININTLDNLSYNGTWTEVQANTMSYYYFNYPSFWDFNEYPIDHNSISDKLKSILYYHILDSVTIEN